MKNKIFIYIVSATKKTKKNRVGTTGKDEENYLGSPLFSFPSPPPLPHHPPPHPSPPPLPPLPKQRATHQHSHHRHPPKKKVLPVSLLKRANDKHSFQRPIVDTHFPLLPPPPRPAPLPLPPSLPLLDLVKDDARHCVEHWPVVATKKNTNKQNKQNKKVS